MIHRAARPIVAAFLLYWLLAWSLAAPAAQASAALSIAGPVAGPAVGPVKTVRYLGYHFSVPRSWPVIRNAQNPHGCVRFDQHALYLGPISGAEFCPSWLLGTTESMLVQPGSAHAAKELTEDKIARQITVRAPRIVITATFDTDPRLITSVLASAGLPTTHRSAAGGSGPVDGSGQQAAVGAKPERTGMHYPMAKPMLPATVASYTGLGFDACAAPSRRYMRAWRRHSPYRAVGIYIGGADRACAQPNLSRAWVRAQAAAGWRFMPLYAGPQAAFGELREPYRQGRAAGRDAVAQARRLGFGPRTPLYYDMEAFGPRSRVQALQFLSAWTRTLHRRGYSSGVYSSSDSGVVDLARNYRSRAYLMPDYIYDALWNGRASTWDGNLRIRQWPRHRRIHQYSGNVTQTFGGDTISIDKDFLNIEVSAPYATAQSSSAVAIPGGRVLVCYRGRSRLWVRQYAARSGWSKPVAAAGQGSAPSVVRAGSVADVFYRGSGGFLWDASYSTAGRLRTRQRLAMMGVLGSAPRAVAQPDGVIDVFWRGSADDHLWHAQYTPGSGWNGPQGLGGDLASLPVPVTSSAGFTAVFWKGANRGLWMIGRGLSGKWGTPRSLGMAPLGGAPQATAQRSGDIEVYWHGLGNPYLWEGFYRPQGGWRGPRDLGGQLRSAPWPVTAAGTVSVLWRGPGHQFGFTAHRRGAKWNALTWQPPEQASVGWIGSPPFAAVGGPGTALRVFWRGRGDSLWTSARVGQGWTKPASAR